MTDESVATPSSDPLKAVADALDAAVKVAEGGAQKARSTASDALPVAAKYMSSLVYNTCYSISYGLVFPSVMVARSIPKDNAAVHGLIDGAHAAMDMVEGMRSKPEV
jgi:hypothetical protein